MKRCLKIFALTLGLFFSLAVNLFADEIPDGYGEVRLGMSLEAAKEALKKNIDFGYHGDRDVSLLPGENRVLIETDAEKGLGSNFLNRCWFQFADEELYIIIINVNTQKMDYYSIFTTLCDKYGNPDSLNPEKAVWKNDKITMSLEKPLTLKYVDNKKFQELQNKATVQPGAVERNREDFLSGL